MLKKNEAMKFPMEIASEFIVNHFLSFLNLLLILSPYSIFIADISFESYYPLIQKQFSFHLNKGCF